MTQLEALQGKLMAEMQKMSDPAYTKQLEAKKQEFGCESLSLALTGANLQGRLRCGQKFGRDLTMTGTLKVPREVRDLGRRQTRRPMEFLHCETRADVGQRRRLSMVSVLADLRTHGGVSRRALSRRTKQIKPRVGPLFGPTLGFRTCLPDLP